MMPSSAGKCCQRQSADQPPQYGRSASNGQPYNLEYSLLALKPMRFTSLCLVAQRLAASFELD